MNIAFSSLSDPDYLNQETLLHRITNRIRQSLELNEILTKTVEEVRSFLGTDRVKIYRFHPDASGEVVAESIHNDRLPSLLGLNFPADDIPPHARELFLKARQRSIVNLASQQIGLSPLENPETGEPLDTEDIRFRPVDPCHVEYLKAMGVQSSLVVPLLPHLDSVANEPQLWGLLVSHHSEPRIISERELQIVQLVADQVAIAIAQATLLARSRQQAQREAEINRVTSLLHSPPTIQFQAPLKAAIEIFGGSGGRLYLAGRPPYSSSELYESGAQPLQSESFTPGWLEESAVWRGWIGQLEGDTGDRIHPDDLRPRSVTDLYKEPELRVLAARFQSTQIRGILVVPLFYRQGLLGCLTIFRDEIDTETLWAGQVDPDQRQFQPRNSFGVWRELKKGQAQVWTDEELRAASVLGSHFAMAIQQYQMYRQIQSLNTNLEQQVQERTAQLQKSLQDLRQTQMQLIQAERLSSLGQLVAGVAYEIDNPINFIHGNLVHTVQYTQDLLDLLQLYQQKLPTSDGEIRDRIEAIDLDFLTEDMPKTLNSMQVGADRICQIILALLNFSRLDQAEMKPVDLHEGIDATLLILQHRLKPRAGHSGIQVIRDYGNLPLVECYAGQLNQVFMSLLSYCIPVLEESRMQNQAISPSSEPTIWVSTDLIDTTRVMIRISHNGAPLFPEIQQELFSPDLIGSEANRNHEIGLSISYQVVTEKHGGSLQCVSLLDRNTEFVIEIPIQQVK